MHIDASALIDTATIAAIRHATLVCSLPTHARSLPPRDRRDIVPDGSHSKEYDR